ncbi:NADH:flavin oxidoreductase/NADH oxidase [Seiridium cupressi]
MSKLFEPLKVGAAQLKNRCVLAPLTRYRCDDDWVPLPMVKEYYSQRASVPGTLLITEATIISERAVGRRNVPGIWTEAQIAGWKSIVDAVHAKGCFIYCQLWHQGRAGWPDVLQSLGHKLVSSSAVPIDETRAVPEEMTEEEIWQSIGDYAAAAKNAITAGFDGVEIHGANGYLVDQFLQDKCNKREDGWGGSIEKRSRYALEVTKAVVEAVGADKTAIRLSPFSDFQGMLMDEPLPTFEYVVRQLKLLKLAYLHLIEARITGNDDSECGGDSDCSSLVKVWDNQSPVLLAGGFKPDNARKAVDETYKEYDVAIVFGRYFISNPDLVFRMKENIELVKYDRAVFYTPKKPEGHFYKFLEQIRGTGHRIVKMPSNQEVVRHADFDPSDVEVVSIRRHKSIELVEPDTKWASNFVLIAQRIHSALGSRALAIEHVGSTSVPNLPAKDVIDIDLVVADPSDEGSYVEDLGAAGFQFLFREPNWHGHRFFGLDEPYANLHVFGPSSPEVVRHRIFSKCLRENEDDRLAYEKVKREAAEAARGTSETVNQYNNRKEPVIRQILDRAFQAQGLLES